jgi:hypothetical protein
LDTVVVLAVTPVELAAVRELIPETTKVVVRPLSESHVKKAKSKSWPGFKPEKVNVSGTP